MRRADGSSTSIGNLDSERRANVDGRGRVSLPTRVTLDWAVRSTDRWHVPASEPATAVGQRLLDAAPVVETTVRVPGGQAVHRAWCVLDRDREWALVEVENRSRQPVAVALAVGGARRSPLVAARRPSRAGSTMAELLDDGGSTEAAGGEPAVVFPLAHTAMLRVALPMGRRQPLDVDLAGLPGAERVASGWRAHAQPPGSLRVVLPDERLAGDVAAARAALVLRATAADRALLARFGHRVDAPRRPRRRAPDDPASRLLAGLLDQLVRVDGERTLAIVTAWPDEWLGQGLEVHDAPTPWGRLSYAVRWHGARPALLWELDAEGGPAAPVTVVAPGLDPAWSSTDARGEALLAPVEPAGGLPKVVAPLAGAGTDPGDVAPGGTFA